MAKIKLERTPEYIREEIDILHTKGFDSTSINLILKIEEKLNSSIYNCIATKTTAEQLRAIKDKIFNAKNFKPGNITYLFAAAKRNLDISKLDVETSEYVLGLQIKALAKNIDYEKYFTNDMPDCAKMAILRLSANGIDLDYFNYKEFKIEDLEPLCSLSDYVSSKIGKENFITFFKDTSLSPEQFRVLFINCDLNKNKIDLNLCNPNLNIAQLEILSSYKGDYNDIYPLVDEKISAEKMEVFLNFIEKNVDMSKYYHSNFDSKHLSLIGKVLYAGFNPAMLENEDLPLERLKLMQKMILQDENKYDLNIFNDTTISDEVAKSIYVLQKNGYKIIGPEINREER